MSRKLTEKEKEDLERYKGSYRLSDKPDVKKLISEQVNPPYNSSEDMPEGYRSGNIDASYNKYAEDNPVKGTFLKLKRFIGKGLHGGKEK